MIDHDGNPLRIDKAYSWETPIASHGLMHMVITNATNHDPYAIDTLILFGEYGAEFVDEHQRACKRCWSRKTRKSQGNTRFLPGDGGCVPLRDGEFRDLVLPDTTYSERHDCISLLDRPISEPDAAADAIRYPLVELDRDVKPWQEVLVELASRLKFPRSPTKDGTRKFKNYPVYRSTTNVARA